MGADKDGPQALLSELGASLGGFVKIEPVTLPSACSCLWLGYTGTDRILVNPDWPGTAVAVTGHALGHLVLGHCGQVRDGGQFACAVRGANMATTDLDRLKRLLHDPAEGVSRLFSDGEEQAATDYARDLAARLDRHVLSDQTPFACVG